MKKYIPSNEKKREELLNEIGVKSFEELIKHIPKNLRSELVELDEGIDEYQLLKDVKKIAQKNKTTEDYISFMGCGIYDHYIPPLIKHIVSRPEFYTAYTPYQPEVSQGTLQSIYEFQSMVCELYKMDVANASMYDGATATAEACHMAMSLKGKEKVLLSKGLNIKIAEVIHTYLKGQNIECDFVDLKDGTLDIEQLEKKLDDSYAAFVLQTPNFFGFVEDGERIGKIVKEKGVIFIVNQNPMTLPILKPAGDMGADIAIGEGQVFGLEQNFGGPLLGIFASRKEYIRSMPGRIIARTKDKNGKESFVMTLQTREQHIKREKATSNICTNEGLCMLMATVYLSALGKKGLKKVSTDSLLSAHYLKEKLKEVKGVEILYDGKDFFNEFPVKIKDLDEVYKKMKDRGFLIGVKLEKFSKDYKDMLLIASTEKRSKDDIDLMVKNLKEVL
ncbi:MAG: aminomethyl-transferring glycine dehydrogenase subunit GcvPA [bacterium]|uniref:Probable glycine dehydrogenase (decarboxylating) subunit 1 n=2 Tax=Bacteria candidate phyla TaxID=1783234 RepID=A0A101I402_UNCT6|nr:MAG: glycine dehydrogenase subunit 1 [candidate division TA06 bacterium 32_111]KUK87838.1 MAG: glycine dehydrogenase subunit 1 [candidate division TA06 bacterium 34_109]MDI6700631.1 aminomethyl-transferring glycine dehydrogenase subunit GcvPA [bacterium]HAF07991.1 aminomethyl-transferring glycine dehydrogenase subunit GcvPA [candidate division WOR-3 bacterium]HCP16307.1 aminomethyl-transferring glycine dehydrogenase subunit GcvPA [candidate division WOR-3 bacterium]